MGVALEGVGADGCGERAHAELALHLGEDGLYCEDWYGGTLGSGSCRHIR